MVGKVSHDTPLFEVTLRKYERPYDLGKRDIVRRVCLSLGLLSPGESRDAIVDMLYVLLEMRKRRQLLTAEGLARRTLGLRKKFKKPGIGVATSNIRRQLARLKELLIVEKIDTGYRITEWMSLEELYQSRIEAYLLEETRERIRAYLELCDEKFPVKKPLTARKGKK